MGADPITLGIMAAAGGLQALQQHKTGQAQSRLASVQAENYRSKAKQEQAVAQRKAYEHRKDAELRASRIIAVAAATGGTAQEKSVLELLGDISERGEYNALTETYQGDMEARDLNYQAKTTQEKGRSARRAANIQSIGTLFSTASSMAGGFKTTKTNKPKTNKPWQNPDMKFGGY